jgi:DNA primase
MSLGFWGEVGLIGSSSSKEQGDLIVKIVRPDGLVTIFTDGDDAGERCAVSIFNEVAARRRVRWAKLQEGKGPTDCTSEELQAMLDV